ncbi:MAG: SWIM zinc finger family protein [Cyanobacteria bacterium P01_D01_bin.44]
MPTKSKPLAFTEADLKKLATPQSFDRGQSYYRGNSIENPMRQGNKLSADCWGSQRYRTQVTLSNHNITHAKCTCPYDWGGICKHQVALLLTYIHEPDSFQALDSLSKMLSSHSREDLIGLIAQMVERSPDLLRLIEISAIQTSDQPFSISTYQRQMQKAMNLDDLEAIVDILDMLKGQAEQITLNGDWHNGGRLYDMLLSEMTVGYSWSLQEIDYDGEVACYANDFARGLAECLAHMPPGEKIRIDWLDSLLEAVFHDIDIGGMDYAYPAFDGVIEQATQDEWQVLEARIQDKMVNAEDWDRRALVRLLTKRQEHLGNPGAADALVHELGTPEQKAFLLIQEQRFDEAIAIAHQHFTDKPGLVTRLADALLQAKQPEKALHYITEQIQRGNRYSFTDWLIGYHQHYGDPKDALNVELDRFWTTVHQHSYQRLRQVADQLKQWDTLKPQLLKRFKKEKYWSLLLDIALEDQDADAVLTYLKKLKNWEQFKYYAPVAKLVSKTHPDKALELYQALVQRLIDQRGRESYRAAAQYLLQVRQIITEQQSVEAWSRYIGGVRSHNKTLRALHDELAKAGL